MSKDKRIQIRLSEQEYNLIMTVLKTSENDNISKLVRDFLKEKVLEKINENEELQEKLKESLYTNFFK